MLKTSFQRIDVNKFNIYSNSNCNTPEPVSSSFEACAIVKNQIFKNNSDYLQEITKLWHKLGWTDMVSKMKNIWLFGWHCR